jgi:pimeloyl-ACP methyl ester carboxylesterase
MERSGRLVRDDGETNDGETLAWKRVEGEGATVLWLGGFRSDMGGSKAQALADWAQAKGRSYLRFDYFGHGESSGAFVDGTIGRWRADALAVIDALTTGPLVLVGSSMGGWIACLAALARPERIKAVVLVAPAADFTDKLIEPELDDDARAAIDRDGVWIRESDYGDGDPITRQLLQEGRAWSILPGPVEITAPLRVLQGLADPDVPWRHAFNLALSWAGEDVVFSLIRDGDHRLSRPQDLRRLIAAVEDVAA